MVLPGHVEPSGPFPGVPGASPMLAAFDSLEFESGGGAAAMGFEGTLATAREVPRIGPRRTRAVVRLGGGDFTYDENGLAIERGDSSRWLRAEVSTGQHDAAGPILLSGWHLWQVASAWSHGPHRLEGGFGQRGSAASVAAGEEQSVGGLGGYLRYRHTGGPVEFGAAADRAYDRHDTFGGFLAESRRDAQEDRGTFDVSWAGRRVALALTGSGGTSKIRREGDQAFDSSTRWAWGTAEAGFTAGPGRIEAALGGGRHGALQQTALAPSLDYRLHGRDWQLRAGVERSLWAVWSDLGAGEEPFLQSTWVGVLDARVTAGAWRMRGTVLEGRTRDRALLTRHPLEGVWLLQGFRVDPDVYDFTLGTFDLGWRGRRWRWSAEGFALVRPVSLAQPNVDPGWGGRAEAEYGATFFGGDLAVGFGGGVEVVGARVSDSFDPQTLPAYATSIVHVTATIAGAELTIQGRNLENRVQPEAWLDSSTLVEALGTGRELRFYLTVHLSN